jgi:hypothetical protein
MPRTGKMQAHDNGKKRGLVIRKCGVEETARIVAKTNADETGTELIVKCKDFSFYFDFLFIEAHNSH